MSNLFTWKLHGDGKTLKPGEVVEPDERLTWPRTAEIGAQHVIAMFGATFLVPILTGFDPSTTLFFTAMSTALFLLINKNMLPSYLGSSFGFIAPITAVTTAHKGIAVASFGIMVTGLLLALIATVICLVIAFPVGYFLSRLRVNKQHIMLMLVMLPMWMNFLLRTYAWMGLLSVNGPVNAVLGLFGLGPYTMLNTSGAVVLGMVYNYVPYMILPLYTSMTKIDQSLVEAAQDLGASTTKTLVRVLIPMSVPGISTGITMVFVPAVSTFVISRMLGGGSNLLIGDLIEMQFLGNSYNLNVGSAMSLVLMIIVLLCMSFTSSFDEDEMEGVS